MLYFVNVKGVDVNGMLTVGDGDIKVKESIG